MKEKDYVRKCHILAIKPCILEIGVAYTVQRLPHLSHAHLHILGDPEVTANLYCNFAYPYWEGCVTCSIDLRVHRFLLIKYGSFF